MKKIFALLIIAAGVLVVNSCNDQAQTIEPPSDDKNPAMNNPDKFAWEMSIEVNKPADIKKPDSSVIWETWALARIVFDNPNKLPVWEESQKSNQQLKGFDFMPIQQQRISQFLGDDFKVMFD